MSEEISNGAAVGSTELLALRIRNLIATREFNTAEAVRDENRGGWLCDYAEHDKILGAAIDQLLLEANASAQLPKVS